MRANIATATATAALLVTSCDVTPRTQMTSFDAPSSIVIQADHATIAVVGGPDQRVDVSRRLDQLSIGARWTQKRVADTLVMMGSCPPLIPCRLDVHLTVPSSVPVFVELETGEVQLAGVDRADLNVNAGVIEAAVLERLDAIVGDGSVVADLASGASAGIAVAMGGVELTTEDSSIDLSARVASVSFDGVHDGAGPRVDVVAPGADFTVSRRAPLVQSTPHPAR